MASVLEGEVLDQPGAAGDVPSTSTSSASNSRQGSEKRRQESRNRPGISIIREIYESENACEIFEQQLEQALAIGAETIVIEPFKLGDETARWISVGNCLHKTAVLSGFGSMLANFVWPDKTYISVPLALLSTLCTGMYSISWQSDPCCKYQVETDARRLAKHSIQTLNPSSPVVLVRRDDTRRRILHSSVTIACITQTLLRLYYPVFNQFLGRFSNRLGVNTFSPMQSIGAPERLIVSEVPIHQPLQNPIASSFMRSVGGIQMNML